MMSYIDWEYYSSLCKNCKEVTEDKFDALDAKAELKIDVFTHMRVKNFMIAYDESTATDFQKQAYNQIKMTVCDMINKIIIQESSNAGNGVTSVSNDGYSESYAVVTQQQKDAELKSIVLNGLSGLGLAGVL